MASKFDEEDEMFESSESDDSDAELQKAFMKGELKVGLNKPAFVPRAERPSINNVEGLKQKLEQITKKLDWIERMDVTYTPSEETQEETEENNNKVVHDDFKREMKFYKQAQHAVATAIPKLQSLGIPTKRPEDYFAEMVKTDEHMQRVRAKLLSKQQGMERSEKMKKLREMKKFGKKVQQDVLQKRQKEKKQIIESVKKFRKGKQSAPEFIKGDDFDVTAEKEKRKPFGKSNKRKAKDKKFGHGGKKRGMKGNTRDSTSDVTSFNSKKHSKAPRQNHAGKKRKAPQRPGKTRRKRMKH